MIPYLALFLLFHLFYIYCTYKKNLGFIDSAWGLGFIVFHLGALIQYYPISLKPTLIMVCISIWGIRLAIYLHKRNSGKPEDFRYKNMRDNWKGKAPLHSYFKVFWLQAVLLMIISIPSFNAIKTSGELKWYNMIGLFVWAFGFIWETWADSTLAKFKIENKGICKLGPWKYSRHPNYFGEIVLWWGIYLATIPNQPWMIIGPILIHFLILKVSGIPMLEAKYKDNPIYQEYINETNSLIPKIF